MQQQFDQGGVPVDLEQAIYRNFQETRMPSDVGQPVMQRFRYLRSASETRRFNQVKDHWLKTMQVAFDRGGVSPELEQEISQNLQEIGMPTDTKQPVIQRLQYLRTLSEIRWGNVPRITVNTHLDSDEYAHFEMTATYHKPAKQVKLVPGRLIGSNKKLYFYSSTGADSVTIN